MKSLRHYRKALGMTQAEIASALGCSREAVQKWESGNPPPPKYVVTAARSMSLDGDLEYLSRALQDALVAIRERGAK